jgi:hypothetical protein
MTLLRDESSSWGRCPHTPGIYRIPARMTERRGRSLGLRSFRPLSRRSGCVPAVPLSSAQVFPEWITETSPCNDLALRRNLMKPKQA